MNNEFETYLRSLYSEKPNHIEEAELYSLLAGGKRIRPQLLFAVLKDNSVSEREGYPYAAAIEMIHTYSLIHDDLPAMDNADLRRGKKTNPLVYGEAMAILAGDALLTKAFILLAKENTHFIKSIITEYAIAAGDHGMIYGQMLDLEAENKKDLTAEDLQELDRNKTGKLLALPLIVGASLAGRIEDIDQLRKIGEELGIAFQIQDDIFDATKDAKQLGKSISDNKNHKQTYVSIWGLETAKQMMNKHFDKVLKALSKLNFTADNLSELIKQIRSREN